MGGLLYYLGVGSQCIGSECQDCGVVTCWGVHGLVSDLLLFCGNGSAIVVVCQLHGADAKGRDLRDWYCLQGVTEVAGSSVLSRV